MKAPATDSKPPRWYYGWNIVAVCVLSQVAALALTLNCFTLFLHAWTHEFGIPVSTLAFSVTIFSVGCAIVCPFAGAAADRFPARWVFGAALIGLVAFHAAIGFVTAGWQIVLLYSALLPIAISFAASVPAQAVVSRWFVRRVGLAMGLTAFGLALAGVIFPTLIGWLTPILGWRRVWWLFSAAIAVVVLPVVVGVIRDRPGEREGLDYVGPQAPAHLSPKMKAADIFKRPNFWVTIGVFVPIQCCFMGISINLAPLVLSRGFNTATAAVLLSLMSATALVAKLASGVTADRIGNRTPLVLTALIAAAGVAVLAFSGRSLPLMFAALTLMGLTQGVWTLLASATVAEFGAQGFGRAFGVISAFTPIGALAPPMLARLQETSGSYVGGLMGLALFALVGAGVGLLLKERHPPGAPAQSLGGGAVRIVVDPRPASQAANGLF
jgi:MFS family permease